MDTVARTQAVFRSDRRAFVRQLTIPLLGAGVMGNSIGCCPAAAQEKRVSISSGIKLAEKTGPADGDTYLEFLQQMGLEYVDIHLADHSYENLVRLRERYESFGLKLWVIDHGRFSSDEKIRLGLPGRDEEIEHFKVFLRNMGRAGIPAYIQYGWLPRAVERFKEREKSPQARGCMTDAADLESARTRARNKPLPYGRVYREAEMWSTFTYFVRQVIPVAEKAGVKIAIHPNEAFPELSGVANICGTIENLKRMVEIANSDAFGLAFCVGTVATGAGTDAIVRAIRYFGGRRKIFNVHFRNISAPLPKYAETFVDNGYVDMYAVMKALVEVGFDGSMIPDHIPVFVEDAGKWAHRAYTIGYTRALLQRAVAEKGRP